jgi:hypothetical protein
MLASPLSGADVEGSKLFRNVGKYPSDYAVQHKRTQQFSREVFLAVCNLRVDDKTTESLQILPQQVSYDRREISHGQRLYVVDVVYV